MVPAPALMPTLGHSKSTFVAGSDVPLAVVVVAELKNAVKDGAGVLNIDDEQPERTALPTMATAASKRRPTPIRRIPTPYMLND